MTLLALTGFLVGLSKAVWRHLRRRRRTPCDALPRCPECCDGAAEVDWQITSSDYVPSPRCRGYGRLPVAEARRYALEMIGAHYAQDEPFFIGGVAVLVAKVHELPPTTDHHGRSYQAETRSLSVTYPDGADEYFEFETTGQLIYRGEISE